MPQSRAGVKQYDAAPAGRPEGDGLEDAFPLVAEVPADVGRRDAREMPRATGCIVEGSAHLANISHAALVNELILEHLAATDSYDHG